MNTRRTLQLLLAATLAALVACSTPQSPSPPAAPAPPADPAPPAEPEPPADAAVPVSLTVDHAWVRDADTPGEQSAQAAAMAALREKVVAGGAFVASWEALGLDGARWHVAEGETYPGDVLPPGVAELPEGAISAIVPGDGGLHLFRIVGREAAP